MAAGEWLAENVGHFDHVLCSTATRTRLTWEQAQLGGAVSDEISFHDELYEAPVSSLVKLIAGLGDGIKTTLVIGHWPGVEELVNTLAVRDDYPGWERLDEKFPTSAIAVLNVSGTWADLGDSSAELADFVIPRG